MVPVSAWLPGTQIIRKWIFSFEVKLLSNHRYDGVKILQLLLNSPF